MNPKNRLVFWKKSQPSNFEEKINGIKPLCPSKTTIYTKHFPIKLTQFEKTGSLVEVFIPLGNLILKFHFQNYKSITFFVTFTFDSRICLLLPKERTEFRT